MLKNPALVILILVSLTFVALINVAWGQAHDNCNGQSCNDSGSVMVGETVVGGDSSRVLAVGGGDVDINDYYRSFSYFFGLVQETRSNPLAVARDLMVEGNYEAAAVLRCKPWGVHRAFGGRDECEKALSKAPILPLVPRVGASQNDSDEDDDWREEQQQMQQAYAEDMAELESRVASVESRPQTQEIIGRTVDLGADRRARARAARDEVLKGAEQ